MRIRVAAVLLVLASLAARAQEPPKSFPASFQGAWKGLCSVVRGGKTTMSFPMELHIEPLAEGGGWTWRVVYGEGEKRQVRPYELLPVEGDPNRFRIDEKNSIVIDSFLENDTLHSRFWVADNVIEATYARDGDALTVTLTTFGAKPSYLSGGRDGTPKVASYGLLAVQRAKLAR